MELTGRVIVSNMISGVSKATGREWRVKNFVISYQDSDKGNCNLAFEMFGDSMIANNPFEQGDLVTVAFNLESNEWNGRWYTKCNAYSVTKVSEKEVKKATKTKKEGTKQPVEEELPF